MTVKMLEKAAAFLMQEPQDKNESLKAVVALRFSSLVYMAYLLILAVATGVMESPGHVAFAVAFMLLYAYIFYCSYQDRMKQVYVLLNFVTVLWVSIFYLSLGSAVGVQHFLYALILIDILLNRKHPVVILSVIYLIRLILYIYVMFQPPVQIAVMHPYVEIFLYAMSLVMEGAIVLFVGIYFTKDAFQMETRLQRYNDELRHIASTDPLTKLWNRFKMLEHVEKCQNRFSHGELSFLSVAIGDIDYFKRVNDTYGHECGDEVLRTLAELFRREMDKKGAVARWGGEEFLFMFENMNGDDAWLDLCQLQGKVGKLDIPYEDQVLHVTMTFGLIEYDHNLSLDENIKLADDKLYKGKANGRDRIVY